MFNFADDIKEVNYMIPDPVKRQIDGCTLLNIERDKDSNSRTYQAVTFTWREESTKAQLSHKEFFPKKGDADDELWKSGVSLSASRLAHIARAYMTDEEYASLKVSGDSKSLVESVVQKNWIEITSQIGKILNPKIVAGTTGDTSLKVVYNESGKGLNKKYFAGLPKVPPFISTPNHPKKFEYNPKYDRYVKPGGNATPDAELPSQGGGDQTNAFENAGSGAAAGDDDF